MFDSPFDFCPVHHEMVLLDQTLEECARDHHCDDPAHCPIGKCFVGTGDEARQLQKDNDDRNR
ncbi:MAG TPA: hypothetical protein VL968_09955 [Rhodocyclaceae bacterium]|jgi:hypothetical protein|nr:hypothetical protein [Rhodocyclaceae bacterium]